MSTSREKGKNVLSKANYVPNYSSRTLKPPTRPLDKIQPPTPVKNTYSPFSKPTNSTIPSSSRPQPSPLKQTFKSVLTNAYRQYYAPGTEPPTTQTGPKSYFFEKSTQSVSTLEFPFDSLQTKPNELADILLDPATGNINTFEPTFAFYEYILVETESIQITTVPHSRNPTELGFCKILLYQVLTLEDWGGNPYTTREFPDPKFKPRTYNYHHYQLAWKNYFKKQNSTKDLSWYFYFDRTFKPTIPKWFIFWWTTYGPIPTIFPTTLNQGYEYFLDQINSNTIELPVPWNNYPPLLTFYKHFQLSWILQVFYQTQTIEREGMFIPELIRVNKVKWWDKMRLDNLDLSGVQQWIQQNPQLIVNQKQPDPEQFCLNNSQLATLLTQASAQLRTVKSAKEQEAILQMLQTTIASNKGTDSEHSATSPIDQFEDEQDPYGGPFSQL